MELVKDLWLPNIFIYNLKTFKVVEVLSKHAGLWISPENAILYSQATHITFICPMRFDSFPLDTQVRALVDSFVVRRDHGHDSEGKKYFSHEMYGSKYFSKKKCM